MNIKTIRQLIEENPNKIVKLYDYYGIWGELPLTENNLANCPDAVEITNTTINVYVG